MNWLDIITDKEMYKWFFQCFCIIPMLLSIPILILRGMYSERMKEHEILIKPLIKGKDHLESAAIICCLVLFWPICLIGYLIRKLSVGIVNFFVNRNLGPLKAAKELEEDFEKAKFEIEQESVERMFSSGMFSSGFHKPGEVKEDKINLSDELLKKTRKQYEAYKAKKANKAKKNLLMMIFLFLIANTFKSSSDLLLYYCNKQKQILFYEQRSTRKIYQKMERSKCSKAIRRRFYVNSAL